MSRPHVYQLLYAAALCLYILPTGILCDNLRCSYRPILPSKDHYDLVLSECAPDELCFNAEGRYGNYIALSAHGCMAPKDCGQQLKLRLKGTTYTMHYACCDYNYCNSCLGVQAKSMQFLLTMAAVAWFLASL